MSRLGRFAKDAQDRKRYVVDYNDWLDLEELITLVTVTGDNPVDGFFVDGYVVDPGGKQIIYYVSGGDPDTDYDATITVTTDMGQVKEDWITHAVT
jgi:hypothetical protein